MDKKLLSLLETMVRIRCFEETAEEAFKNLLIPGLVHAYIGEEAIAAGVCENLRRDDYIISTLSTTRSDTISITELFKVIFKVSTKDAISIVDWWRGLIKISTYQINTIYDYIINRLSLSLDGDIVNISELYKITIQTTTKDLVTLIDWWKGFFRVLSYDTITVIDTFIGVLTGIVKEDSISLTELLRYCSQAELIPTSTSYDVLYHSIFVFKEALSIHNLHSLP